MDSNEAHVITLKTLKQRCEYLQERLKTVEEENCKLKLEMTQNLNRKNRISEESSNLEEQVIILNKEKSQMTHQIQMIVKENFTLWSHLSKIIPGSTMSDLKLSVYEEQNSEECKLSQYDQFSYDCDRESLEEISLKLLNGIIMGKNELEKQYSQMIDLHKENVLEENLSFLPKNIDSRAAAKQVKEYVLKLKDFKQTLFQQKTDLKKAISIIKKSGTFSRNLVGDNKKEVLENYNREKDINNQTDNKIVTLQNSEETENKNENLESDIMICPMCSFSLTGEFNDFYRHVSAHFEPENDYVDGVQ